MLSWLNEHLCPTDYINIYVKQVKWMFILCWVDKTNVYVNFWADKANVYVLLIKLIKLMFMLRWLNEHLCQTEKINV